MKLSTESPNSRLNGIRRFLKQVPPGSSRLRLLQSEETPLPIGEWQPIENHDAREALAQEIEALVIETACEKRKARVTFLLAWVDEAGQQRTVRELTVYAHQIPDSYGERPEDTARALDGATQSQLAQTQRHLEAMMRMHIQWEGAILTTMAGTIERLSERCASMETARAKGFDELLEAKETIVGLVAESGELTPAQMKAFELVERLAPAFMAWMQAQGQGNAAKTQAAKPNGAAAGKAA